MPFPRTWSEELIAEWLQLEGYFVESGLPIRAGKKGGRSEADIVGARVKDGKLEIFHIEIGTLAGNPKANAEMIREKFSVQRIDAIKEYCRNKLEFPSNKDVKYTKLYVAVWWSDKTLSYLKQQRLPVRSLWEFVNNEIKSTIQQWKQNPPHKPQTRGKILTLPEGMWLLDLVDYLLE
jgi:hypothetical protein